MKKVFSLRSCTYTYKCYVRFLRQHWWFFFIKGWDTQYNKATAATTTEATTTTAAPESTADSTAASGTESEGEGAKDISEMPATLKNYEDASVYFKKDMDISSLVEPFSENDFWGLTSLM